MVAAEKNFMIAIYDCPMTGLTWLLRGGSRKALTRTAALVGIALFCGSAGVLAAPAASAADSEHVSSYEVSIDVRADGTLRVTERIRYDFGSASRHGITRTIPVRTRYDEDRDRIYPISRIQVNATGGASAQTETHIRGANEEIRIGDPSRTVSGQHDYTIEYTVRGALNRADGGVELVWNAIGTEWKVPIDHSSVTVTGPVRPLHSSCTRNGPGDHVPCDQGPANATSVSFGQDALPSGHGATVRIAYPAGSVDGLGPVLKDHRSQSRAFQATPLTVGGGAGLALLGVVGGVVRSRRAARSTAALQRSRIASGTGTAAEDVDVLCAERSPAEAGVLRAGDLEGYQLAATLVDLGMRGFLRVREVRVTRRGKRRQDWQVTRLAEPDEEFATHERALFDALFDDDRTVLLSDLATKPGDRIRPYWRSLRSDVMANGWHRSEIETRQSMRGTPWLVLGSLAAIVPFTAADAGVVGLGLFLGMGLFLLVQRRPVLTAAGRAERARIADLRTRMIEALESGDTETVRRNLPFAIALSVPGWFDAAFAHATVRAAPGSERYEVAQVTDQEPDAVADHDESLDDMVDYIYFELEDTAGSASTSRSGPRVGGWRSSTSGSTGGSGGGGGGGGGSW